MLIQLIISVAIFIVVASGHEVKDYAEYKCSLCINSLQYMQSNMPIIIGKPFDMASACILSFNNNDNVNELSHHACKSVEGNMIDTTPKGDPRTHCISMNLCPGAEENSYEKIKSESNLDFKITKALGSKGYSKVKVTVISNSTIDDSNDIFQYQQQFKYRWTDNFLNSGVIDVEEGQNTITILGQQININLPVKGDGVRGIILSDPCFQSNWITCKYKDTFKMFSSLTGVLNAAFEHEDLSFYQILGDNFYDQQGEYTKQFFASLNPSTKQKLFLSILGNHDFWVNGSPSLISKDDQLGNGFMQYYGQDAMASKSSSEGYDFSINPDTMKLPPASNFFTYNQVGNIGFMAFSGAHPYDENKPYFDEACAWAADESISLLFLEGHWNGEGDGATDGAVPEVFTKLKEIPSCSNVYSKIRYFDGHKHCNYVQQKDVGFMVGGNGMSDKTCAEWGLAVIDTTNDKFQIQYFQLATADSNPVNNYDKVIDCINQNGGISNCYDLATTWVNTPI